VRPLHELRSASQVCTARIRGGAHPAMLLSLLSIKQMTTDGPWWQQMDHGTGECTDDVSDVPGCERFTYALLLLLMWGCSSVFALVFYSFIRFLSVLRGCIGIKFCLDIHFHAAIPSLCRCRDKESSAWCSWRWSWLQIAAMWHTDDVLVYLCVMSCDATSWSPWCAMSLMIWYSYAW
jgi:hypothetical protein